MALKAVSRPESALTGHVPRMGQPARLGLDRGSAPARLGRTLKQWRTDFFLGYFDTKRAHPI